MSAAKFRKRPVEIEAMLYDGRNAPEIFAWMQGDCPGAFIYRDMLAIPNREGAMLAAPGDWIIRGSKDEFYPCKPDVFAATYDPI